MQIEGCKHELEVTVPAEEIEQETQKVVADIQKKVRMPGFRPGKAPASIIRTRFASDVRSDVLNNLIPKYFHKRVEEEDLKVVGQPNVTDVQFEEGQPLKFKAEFEVAPEIELGTYRGVRVNYHEPEVTDEEVTERLEKVRDQKAQFINIEPRPAVDGDFAVVTLKSIAGTDKPIDQEEMVMRIGDEEKLPEFSETLRGMTPGDEREFEINYPEEYAEPGLAGKTVKFLMKLKTLRMKELPELNDEFAQDLGDFQTLDEVREALRKTIFREKEQEAQAKAKEEIIDRLVETHDFPLPQVYVERQLEADAESQFRRITGQPVDIRQIKDRIDWEKFTEQLRPRAIRDVKASLLIDKVADAESIYATNDEVDREVQRIARQEREPVAAMRKKLEKNGVVGRIASQIRTNKTLAFLFEHARKEA